MVMLFTCGLDHFELSRRLDELEKENKKLRSEKSLVGSWLTKANLELESLCEMDEKLVAELSLLRLALAEQKKISKYYELKLDNREKTYKRVVASLEEEIIHLQEEVDRLKENSKTSSEDSYYHWVASYTVGYKEK